MARKRNEEYVNPAVPPYLTYDEQAFVAMYLFTDGNLSEIARQWPHRVTAEDCERLAADPRIKAECEYRMMLEDEVLQGKNVEPRPGHNLVLEIEHIANAFGRRTPAMSFRPERSLPCGESRQSLPPNGKRTRRHERRITAAAGDPR